MNKVNSRGKAKQNGRIQIDSKAKEIVSSTQNKSNKLQAMNNEIMFKIDEILLQYKGYERMIPEINQNSISTNSQSDVNNILDDFTLPLSIPSYSINIKKEPLPLPKIVHRNSAKINQIKTKNGRNPFMTDVGLIKATKKRKKEKKKQDNRQMGKTEKEINDIIRNIDEIDSDDKDQFEGSLEFKARMAKEQEDFKSLLQEIDDYKNQIHEEFDEVKYLIKFANNTHRLIDRHKTVITSIFKGAGLKSKLEQQRENSLMKKNDAYKSNEKTNDSDYIKENEGGYDEDDNEDYEDDDIDNSLRNFDGVFNKLKKINQIKDALSNIQDDFLGYHEKFKSNISQIKTTKKNEDVKQLMQNNIV